MQDLTTKALPKSGRRTPARSVKLAPEGICTAIVAVTGVVDEVSDLIVSGAFAKTLQVRRPKVVFHHQWTDPVGRVLWVQEWMPGDPRLPKKTKDGKPWPADAGALVATMQFNLQTERGRDVFEMVRFYADANEAEFSIGYKVPEGKGARRRDGVRVILEIDLYEVSPVLFGAAPLSMALDVKSANAAVTEAKVHKGGLPGVAWDEVDTATAYAPGFETKRKFDSSKRKAMAKRGTALGDGSFPISNAKDLKNAIRAVGRAKDPAKAKAHIRKRARALKLTHLLPDSWGKPRMESKVTAAHAVMEAKAAEPAAGKGVMVALYPPPEVAEKLAHPDGSPADDLHVTLAYLGDADQLGHDPQELANTLATAGAGPLSGQVGGLGTFPAGDEGTPMWAPVDVPGLSELHNRVVDTLAASPVGDKLHTDHGFTPHLTLGYDLDDVAQVVPTPVDFDHMYLVVGDDRYPIPLGGTPSQMQAGIEAKTAAACVMEAKAGGLDRNHGGAENLRHWYVGGGGAAEIAWGVPDDFYRCVAIASKHMTKSQARGYCALRHREAVGVWPGQEGKSMNTMSGSYEERRRQLEEEARELFGKGDGDSSYCCVEASYDDRVVVTVHGGDEPQSYLIPYTVDADGNPKLGEPEEVKLSVVAVPDGGDVDDGDEVDDDTAAAVRYLSPAAGMLGDVTRLVSMSPLEGKAFDDAIAPALDKLLEAIDVKAGYKHDDEEPDDDEYGGPSDSDADDEDIAADDMADAEDVHGAPPVPTADEPAQDQVPMDDTAAPDAAPAPDAGMGDETDGEADPWDDLSDEETTSDTVPDVAPDYEAAPTGTPPPPSEDDTGTPPEDETDEERRRRVEGKAILDPTELQAFLDELTV